MTMVELPVRYKQQTVVMPWPALKFSDWAKLIFAKTDGEPLLGGYKLANEQGWQAMLKDFWAKHSVAIGHPAGLGNEVERTIPVMIHGDEGRGKLRRAVMITSVQPVVQKDGHLGHSFFSRYLFAVLPGELYAGETSLDVLQDVLVEDLRALLETGLSVPWHFLVGCNMTLKG